MSTKRLADAAKSLVEATKNSFVVPNFVAVTKAFFPVNVYTSRISTIRMHVFCSGSEAFQ